MITEGQLASMRSTVTGALPDQCTIGPSGAPVFDKETGTYSQTAGELVYEGPCRVRVAGQGRGDVVVQAGEEPITLRTYDVTLPWDATGIEVDHVLAVTESSDSALVGRPLRVRDVRFGSWDLGRRLVVEDNLG